MPTATGGAARRGTKHRPGPPPSVTLPDGTQVAFSRAVPGNSLDVFAMYVSVNNGQAHDVTNNRL